METTNQNENTNENTKENTKNTKKAHKKIFLFLLLCAIVGVIYFIYWEFYGKMHIETEDAYVNGNQTTITSQVTGPIEELLINDTQVVNRGDLLATIDDTNYKVALAESEAQLAGAVKKYYSLQGDVLKARDEVNIQSNNLVKATEDYNRDLKSFKAGLISKEKFETTTNIYKNSQLALAQSKDILRICEIQASSSSIYEHPVVKSAIEQYRMSNLNLLRTKIYAPISGTITKKAIQVGQQVSAGQNLLTIIDLNNIWVDANYKETQMSKIKIGNKVQMVSDYNGKSYEGYVMGISPGSGSALSLLPAQNATGNWIKIVQRVPVRIQFTEESLEKNGPIPVGTSIESDINISKSTDNLKAFPSQNSNLYQLDEQAFSKKIEEIVKSNSGE